MAVLTAVVQYKVSISDKFKTRLGPRYFNKIYIYTSVIKLDMLDRPIIKVKFHEVMAVFWILQS